MPEDLVITNERPSATLVKWLADRAEVDEENTALEVAAAQIDAMMQAESPDDFWGIITSGGTTAGKDLEDVELTVHSYTVHKSEGEFSAPLGHFIIIHATRLSNGEPVVINTGSPLVIGTMRWLEAKGLLPHDVVIRGDATRRGRRIWMEQIPRRAARATASVE